MMDYLMSNYIIILFISVIGLCLGSFYNVVILRSLSNESIVFPSSKCPKCGEKLKPWHNIPVLSYIFLRGKCAFCKEKISLQYPLVELTTMGLFLWSFYEFGLWRSDTMSFGEQLRKLKYTNFIMPAINENTSIIKMNTIIINALENISMLGS